MESEPASGESGEREVHDTERAVKILHEIKFFSDLRPDTFNQICEVAEFEFAKLRDIIFYQGDPPHKCYVVLSGEVGVFIEKNGSADAQSAPHRRSIRGAAPDLVSRPVSRGTPSRSSFMRRPMFRSIGDQCSTFGPGTLFGELALMNEMPRAATLKCLDDCEFLSISKSAFENIMKKEMLRAGDDKMRYLLAHVPGLSALPPPPMGSTAPHASYFFKKASFPKGHVFFNQGERSDDIIIVVSKGYVELFYAEQTIRADSAKQLQRPRSRSDSVTSLTSSRSDSKLPNVQRARPSSSSHARAKLSWTTRSVGTLVAGGVFGSLTSSQPNLFTVVASSSSVEVWQASGAELEQIPKSVIAKVQEYIARANAFRLKNHQVNQGRVRTERPKPARNAWQA